MRKVTIIVKREYIGESSIEKAFTEVIRRALEKQATLKRLAV